MTSITVGIIEEFASSMSRYKSPQLAQEKQAHLQRQRRKETSFLVLVIVLMVVVSAVYGVWMYHKIQNRPKHRHQHRDKKPEKKTMRDNTDLKDLFQFTIVTGCAAGQWSWALHQSSSHGDQSRRSEFQGIS